LVVDHLKALIAASSRHLRAKSTEQVVAAKRTWQAAGVSGGGTKIRVRQRAETQWQSRIVPA